VVQPTDNDARRNADLRRKVLDTFSCHVIPFRDKLPPLCFGYQHVRCKGVCLALILAISFTIEQNDLAFAILQDVRCLMEECKPELIV
jgi:hypothetical protein